LRAYAAQGSSISRLLFVAVTSGAAPRDQQSTQPSEASDQKYPRWYPSAIALPNGMVLVAGGFDQDNSVPPDPNRPTKGTQNMNRL
jgi:hypothetical protein